MFVWDVIQVLQAQIHVKGDFGCYAYKRFTQHRACEMCCAVILLCPHTLAAKFVVYMPESISVLI